MEEKVLREAAEDLVDEFERRGRDEVNDDEKYKEFLERTSREVKGKYPNWKEISAGLLWSDRNPEKK